MKLEKLADQLDKRAAVRRAAEAELLDEDRMPRANNDVR